MASPKTIKLGKKDDLTAAIKHLKKTKEKEVLFEVEKGSLLLKSSDSLKVIKRSAEAMGKRIQVMTDDEIGRVLAQKAGVLADGEEAMMPKMTPPRVARSDVKPRFSDIGKPKKITPQPTFEPPKIFTTENISKVTEKILPKVSLPKPQFAHRSKKTKIFVISSVLVVFGFFALAIFLPKADITIYARSEPISRDLEINVDRNISEVDPKTLSIPGLLVGRESSLTESFETSGSSSTGNKAQGTVMLYNFTPYTLTLRASTTTLVANGKKYFFTRDVSGIRPTARTGNQVNEATLTGPIPVVAEGGGESFNLAANTRFEIINTALGDQDVYAVNPGPIAGGASTDEKILTQEDLDRAAGILTEKIIDEAAKSISAERGSTVRLVGNGTQREILAQTANKNIGDVTAEFDMTVIARINGLGFYEQDVLDLVVGKIGEILSDDKYLLMEEAQKYTATYRSVDLAAGRGILSLHYETMAAYKVNNNNLAVILAGKNETEIKEILLSKPEVDTVEVKFWPAWLVHKAPRFNGKVNIETVLSQQ